MPDRLTLEATLVLVAIALGLAFGAAALVGGGASAVKPIATRAAAPVRSTPPPAMELGLTAARAVPALRAPRKGPVKARTPIGVAKRSAAMTLISAPIAPAESAHPTPTAVPRAVRTPAPRVTPAPTPKPESTPFTSPDSSGEFDTTGEPPSEVTDEAPTPSSESGGVAR